MERIFFVSIYDIITGIMT